MGASKEMHPTVKAYALKASKCLELKKDDCVGDCQYENDRCEVSDKAGGKIIMEMFKASSTDCGPVMQLVLDSCEMKSKTECTDTCEYHENEAYEFDEDSKS